MPENEKCLKKCQCFSFRKIKYCNSGLQYNLIYCKKYCSLILYLLNLTKYKMYNTGNRPVYTSTFINPHVKLIHETIHQNPMLGLQ